MVIDYLPFDKRNPDTQYADLFRRILSTGEEVVTEHGETALKIIGHEMRFKLEKGFPLITERDLVSRPQNSIRPAPFYQAIGELCAFLNGAQTRQELERFGCFWWGRWLTPEAAAKFGLPLDDLGPGSYVALRRFPTAEGKPFDQISALLEQIKRRPNSRHHELNPWIPQYILTSEESGRRAVVPPCHGWVHVHINTQTGELTLTHRQRSADVPVGLAFNLIHYGALALMLGQVTGYRPKELVYWIDDAHIYESQIGDVEDLLEGWEPRRLPTITIDPVQDIFAYRAHHFTVSDYRPAKRRKFRTPK